uniref:Transmembrane protein n=1 Tax=Davidia involucrata TaxID=16924 RepID=A0A5B6YQ29_DAVIN
MVNQIAKSLIFLLLALFLVFSSTLASSDAPFIVAHKKTTLTRLKPGAERVSVSYHTLLYWSPRYKHGFMVLQLLSHTVSPQRLLYRRRIQLRFCLWISLQIGLLRRSLSGLRGCWQSTDP